MPTASQPRRAAAIAALPVPVATSRTRQPACRSALSTSCSATITIRAATTPKSPLDHACCWRCLMARRSGLGDSTVVVMPSTVRVGVHPRHRGAVPIFGAAVYLIEVGEPALEEAPFGLGVHERKRAVVGEAR